MDPNQQEWTADVVFHSTVRPAGVRREEPPRGLYRVRVQRTELDNPKNKDGSRDSARTYIRVIATVIGPDTIPAAVKGLGVSDLLNLPHAGQSAKDQETTESFVKKALIALGHPAPAVLALNGGMKLGPAAFMDKTTGQGREAWVFFEPSEGQGTFSETTWLSPEEYAKVVSGELRVGSARKPAQGQQQGARGGASAGGTVQGQGGVDFTAAPSLGGDLPAQPAGGSNGAATGAGSTASAAVQAFLS